MTQNEGIKARWKRLIRDLYAMAGGMGFDPHEEHRRRFAAIEARLDSIEKKLGPANRIPGHEAAPAT